MSASSSCHWRLTFGRERRIPTNESAREQPSTSYRHRQRELKKRTSSSQVSIVTAIDSITRVRQHQHWHQYQHQHWSTFDDDRDVFCLLIGRRSILFGLMLMMCVALWFGDVFWFLVLAQAASVVTFPWCHREGGARRRSSPAYALAPGAAASGLGQPPSPARPQTAESDRSAGAAQAATMLEGGQLG